LIERRKSRILVTADMGCTGMVVASETFFPGWQALVDSRPVPIYEIDGALRGVVAEAGIHRIEMSYRPRSVYAGGLMTLIGLAAAVALALAGFFRRQQLRAPAQAYHEKFA
jgi:uncharacterized membrane protein YfhO